MHAQNTEIALLETKRLNQLEAGERRKKTNPEQLAYLNTHRPSIAPSGHIHARGFVGKMARLNGELTD